MIDSKFIKKSSWLVFFASAFFGVFGPSNLPWFWLIYLLFFVVFFGFILYLIYFSERFVVYMFFIIIMPVLCLSYLASSVAYMSATRLLGEVSFVSVLLGLSPLITVSMIFLFVFFSKSTFFPFLCSGNRVVPRSKGDTTKTYSLGLISGASTLAAGVFLKSAGILTSSVVGALVCTGCPIVVLILLRHTIRGLRTLRTQERSMSIPYTFMQIEEIRDARSRWWLGRLFRWLASICKSESV